MEHHMRRRRTEAQLAALAQPPPPQPGARVELLFLPAGAEPEDRPRCRRIELFDSGGRLRGQADLHLRVAGWIRITKRRNRDERQERTRWHDELTNRAAVDRERQLRMCRWIEISAAD